VPFEALARFKETHRELLAQHQLHLLEVAERCAELPDDPEFDHRLATLRAAAERRRLELEHEAQRAWLGAGFDVARSALLASSTALVGGLAVVRGTSWPELLTVGIPAAMAGVGTAALASMEAAAKIKAQKRHAMAYLFESAKLARRT
jgi:hypothetical protein